MDCAICTKRQQKQTVAGGGCRLSFFCLYMIFKAMIAETGGEWVTVGKQKGRSEFCNEKCVFRFPPEGDNKKQIIAKFFSNCLPTVTKNHPLFKSLFVRTFELFTLLSFRWMTYRQTYAGGNCSATLAPLRSVPG